MGLFHALSEIYDIPISSKSKLLKKLRTEWDVPPKKWQDFSKIKTLLKLTAIHHNHGVIDDKTWQDLGMNAVFCRIDTTLTEIGQQFLYRKIHLLETDKASLKQQYNFACKIQNDHTLREQLQTALYPLSLLSVNSAVKTLFGRLNFITLPRSIVVGWFILSIVVLSSGIFFHSGIFYILTIFVVLTNLFIVRPKLLNATEDNAYTRHCMNRMLSVAKTLGLKKNFQPSLSANY
jgi:hypothetical protein